MTASFAVSGRLLLAGGLLPGAVIVDQGRIASVVRGTGAALPARVLRADLVAPGFIDLQVNGGFGAEVGSGIEALRTLRARLPETGVTGFLATLPSAPPDAIARCTAQVGAAMDEPAGARLLGLHLEGPLLSPERAGAHARAVIETARAEVLAPLYDHPAVRLVTLAPERPGAIDLIRRLVARGAVAAIGHTGASYEEAIAAADAGATLATHVFNAMSAFAHRAPGAVGAALTDPRLCCSLIADGVHAHPAALRLALSAKGAGRLALVSDAMAAAGMPPGDYALAGAAVRSDGIAARLADGTLAGSLLTMDAAVRNLVALAGATVADALRMASEVPAAVLGRAAGIAEGAPADLVLLDGSLRVRATLIAGEPAFTSSA